MIREPCVVVSQTPALNYRAQDLALELGLPLCKSEPQPDQLALVCGEEGLSLACGSMVFLPDFTDVLPRLSQQKLDRELLVRAAKINRTPNPSVIDATAGLGEDSLLLAAAGFRVVMFEKDPIIAALLHDCLKRAKRNKELVEIVSRMNLVQDDATSGMDEIARTKGRPDVVYLDPMFPQKSKSAASKKKFQLLHKLEQPCSNEQELLFAALQLKPQKVVVKRPIKGAFLGGSKPSYSLRGKMVRFDVYAL